MPSHFVVLSHAASHEWLFQNKQAEPVTKPMNAPAGEAGTQAPGAPSNPGQPAGEAPSSSSPLSLFLPLLIMFAVLYFVILRPERKRQKDATNLRSNLKKGDRVLLASGMVGNIASISDDWLVVEIADKVRVTFQRSAVAQVLEAKDKEKADAATPAK
jgi:preprotein translocase subunit YajC